MNASLRTLALLSLLAVPLAGCGKEPTSPVLPSAQAPALPPASSMNFDFGFFEQNGGAQVAAQYPTGVEATQERSHWINAVVRVIYLNLTVADLFEAPVLALNAALGQEPTLGEDGWWTWTYTFQKDGHDVTLKLRAYVNGQVVTWRMLVTDPSAAPPMSDFVWFTGETRLANDSGYWLFNERVGADPLAVARIDWSNASATKRQLSFRNVREGTEDFGDQLEYRLDGTDVSVTFHDASANQDALITWDEATGRGSIQVPDYNGGARGCWDEQQQNVDCAPAAVATAIR